MHNKLVFEQILTQKFLSKNILVKLKELNFNEWLYSGDDGYIDIETTVSFCLENSNNQVSFNPRIGFCVCSQNKENLIESVYLDLGYFVDDERFEYHNIPFNKEIPFGQQVLNAIIDNKLSSDYLEMIALFPTEHNTIIARLNSLHSFLIQKH